MVTMSSEHLLQLFRMNPLEFFISPHLFLLNSLIALARAVGRDVLWKPLNHRVLLLTRDSRKIVRIAALKTLHKLFIEVRTVSHPVA